MKKKIFGLMVLILVLSLSIPMAAMASVGYIVSLDPEEDQNVIGTEHTVTATVTLTGVPATGVTVDFEVTSGPNATASGSDVTDGSGEASFTYTGDGGCGEDTIEAAVDLVSATATKLWLYDKFSGGGKIIQEDGGKKKTWPKITWGGWAGNTCHDNNVNANPNGYYPVGQFEVTFHNVSVNQFDKHKFVGDDVEQLNYRDFSNGDCPGAYPPPSEANFAQVRIWGQMFNQNGTLHGDDFMLVINGMDNGEPGNVDEKGANEITSDGIRFILFKQIGPFLIRQYDSYIDGDFLADQADPCEDNGVRHELDAGNLQIVRPLIGVVGDGWSGVAPQGNHAWEARIRHGGAGGWRAMVDETPNPPFANELFTGGTVPWLNGGQMWFELEYDDSTNQATLTVRRSSDDLVLGTVTDTSVPGFNGLISIQGKTSAEAAGTVVVDNVKVDGNSVGLTDGFTAHGNGGRDLKYLDIHGIAPGSFTLTGDLVFTWVTAQDEGPALQIFIQNNP